jgi:signal transduction histidine kinase
VERLSFFDVLIKRASFGFLTLLLTTFYFLVVAQWLRGQGLFAWALSLWPVLLLYPWFHARLCRWIDRSWLGRCYSPAEAGRYFLDGLQGLVHERDLLSAAESRLSQIFQTAASVIIGEAGPPAPAADAMVARLRDRGQPVGYLMVAGRRSGARFLSEDQMLLSSLAESTSFLLENIRLREKRIEQETREQELVLSANRSQLKALRAQINPHFLFNALNTIAGLIPEHPDRADHTIERLADVFRYTLCWAEREWVPLEEEIRAVCAYLEVEQARFDDTLTVRTRIPRETAEAQIPCMIVQTLVENAVKHGVAAICGPGLIEIESRIQDGSLIIQVRDNGPGFDEQALRRAAQPDSTRS